MAFCALESYEYEMTLNVARFLCKDDFVESAVVGLAVWAVITVNVIDSKLIRYWTVSRCRVADSRRVIACNTYKLYVVLISRCSKDYCARKASNSYDRGAGSGVAAGPRVPNCD